MGFKRIKRIIGCVSVFVFAVSLCSVGDLSVKAETTAPDTVVTPDNPMLHFVMRVRWGNVIDDPITDAETDFSGSIQVSSNARVSLQRVLLFDNHNDNADKITSRTDPVSWNSLIFGHWDGVKVVVSSPANDNITISTAQGELTMSAQEFYDLKEQYVQDVGNGMEIVVDVHPSPANPNYFLKVFWGKVDRNSYVGRRCKSEAEGTSRCLLPLINANGSFKIDSGGTVKLVRTLRFERSDRIDSQSESEINWTSKIYGGVDGVLVNLRLNSAELDKSDTVTLSFNKSGWTKSFSIVDIYHDGFTQEVVSNGYGVVLQVWRRPNRSLIRVKNKKTVYVVEDGVKQPIPSEEVLRSQGLTFKNVEVVDQEEADTYFNGDPINYADGTVVQEEGRPEVYVITNGERKHIQDPKAFVDLGYSWNSIVKVKPGVLGLYRKSSALKSNSVHPEGALVRVKGAPTVYVIKGGRRVPISSVKLFNAYRFDWNKVLVVNKNQVNKFKSDSRGLEYPDGTLLRSRSGKVYKIDQGKKRWIRSGDDFSKAGYKPDEVIDVDEEEISKFEEGVDIVADDIVETND